jgi:hypothetical protein
MAKITGVMANLLRATMALACKQFKHNIEVRWDDDGDF